MVLLTMLLAGRTNDADKKHRAIRAMQNRLRTMLILNDQMIKKALGKKKIRSFRKVEGSDNTWNLANYRFFLVAQEVEAAL
jgi:hypothetical protein